MRVRENTLGEPDCVIYNAGGFPANRYTTGITSRTSVDLNYASGVDPDVIAAGPPA